MIGWLRKRQAAKARVAELEASHLVSKATIEKMARELGTVRHELARSESELMRIEASCALPGLSPGEIERLAILAEECGEVAQAVGKVLRFGWEGQSPYGGRVNRVAVEREIGNLRAIVNLMLDADDLRLKEVQTWQRTKRVGLGKWTQYQACSISREERLALIEEIAATINK